MGKSLVKIHTRVRVQLRVTNHCLRPLSVRILRMGPRLQGRLLTTVSPSPPGVTSGQGHQLEHLQGKKDTPVLLCHSPRSHPEHPPHPSQNNRFGEGVRQGVVFVKPEVLYRTNLTQE